MSAPIVTGGIGVTAGVKWSTPTSTSKVDTKTGDASTKVQVTNSVTGKTVTVSIGFAANGDIEVRVEGNTGKGASMWVLP